MGEVLALIFFGKPDEGFMSVRTRIAEISKGILTGALEAEGLSGLEHCMEGGYSMYYEFKEAIVLFKKKTRNDTVEGLNKISHAISDIQNHFTNCDDVKADYSRLAEVAVMLHSPRAFAFHVGADIMVNGVNIFKHIANGTAYWGAHSYEPFGQEMGAALALLFIGKPNVAAPMMN